MINIVLLILTILPFGAFKYFACYFLLAIYLCR